MLLHEHAFICMFAVVCCCCFCLAATCCCVIRAIAGGICIAFPSSCLKFLLVIGIARIVLALGPLKHDANGHGGFFSVLQHVVLLFYTRRGTHPAADHAAAADHVAAADHAAGHACWTIILSILWSGTQLGSEFLW